MVALGEEASSQILRNLHEEEIEKLGKEISNLGRVDRAVAEPVISEFLSEGSNGALNGGQDYVQRLVNRTLGQDGSRKVLAKISGDKAPVHLGFDETDPQHLAKFIQNEHPQTVALVLAHLEPPQAARVFGLLPAELQSEITVRMASLEEISPEIVQRIGSVLQQKLESFGDFNRESYGGIKAVADLLNRLENTRSREVLEEIESSNPDLALSVRNLMFVFDDLVLLDSKAIREVLQRVDKKTLAVALKGTTEELKELFFRNMSQRAGENLKEEMDLMGPVKLKDVEEAQKEIVDAVTKLEEEGVVSIGSGADEYVL